MSGPYGLTPQGWVAKPLLQIETEMIADFIAIKGNSIDTSQNEMPEWGIFAGQLSQVWQLGQSIYDAQNRNSASGIQLVAIGSLTGTTPFVPTFSRVMTVCCGTPGTPLNQGVISTTKPANAQWASIMAATILGAPAWATATTYLTGAGVTQNGQIFTAVAGGVSGGSFTPSGSQNPGDIVSDGVISWLCVGTGTGYVQVEFDAVVAGPTTANPGQLETIQTPVAGWNSIYNPNNEFVLGQATESDAQFRVRQVAELSGQGLATVPAMRAYLLKNIPNVISVSVYENVTDSVDGFGLPPHSVQCVVQGGLGSDITAAIFACVGNSKDTFGGSSGTVIDEQGNSHTINYDVPTAVPIYVAGFVLYDPATFPVNPDNSLDTSGIVNAMLSYSAANWKTSVDVRANALTMQVTTDALLANEDGAAPPRDGVIDVIVSAINLNSALLAIGTAPNPTSTAPIHISRTQLATLTPANISLTLVAGSQSAP